LVGVGDGVQGGGFEDALGLGVVGVFGDAFVLFTANMRDLTVLEHLFGSSRRIYCLISYEIHSNFALYVIFQDLPPTLTRF
jgi:hypothetical protein